MEVLIISEPYSTLPVRNQFSSINTVVENLVKGLLELNVNVTIACIKESSIKANKIIANHIDENGKVSIIKYINEINNQIRQDEFDVIHDHVVREYSPINYPFEKIIITMHMNSPNPHTRCHNLVCISESMHDIVYKQFYEKSVYIHPDKKKLYPEGLINDLPVVHHGLNPNDFYNSENRDDYILFMSRIDTSKGADVLYNVVKRYPKQKFIAVGPHGNMFDTITNANIPNLQYLGFVSKIEKVNLLANAKALLFPTGGYERTWPEPSGLPQIEAMLSGTPVITTEYPKMSEFIDNGKTGWVCKTFNELDNKINDLDKFDNNKIRKEGIKKFSHVRMAQDYIKLYKKLSE